MTGSHIDVVTHLWHRPASYFNVHADGSLSLNAPDSNFDPLKGCVALGEKGFILTGRDLDAAGAGEANPRWPLDRAPEMATSIPGVFAVGDVRAGNVKRVASAVGEGTISIHIVHRALAELY